MLHGNHTAPTILEERHHATVLRQLRFLGILHQGLSNLHSQ